MAYLQNIGLGGLGWSSRTAMKAECCYKLCKHAVGDIHEDLYKTLLTSRTVMLFPVLETCAYVGSQASRKRHS